MTTITQKYDLPILDIVSPQGEECKIEKTLKFPDQEDQRLILDRKMLKTFLDVQESNGSNSREEAELKLKSDVEKVMAEKYQTDDPAIQNLIITLEDTAEKLSEKLKSAQAQIAELSEKVEAKFKEETCFECPGHTDIVGHYDILKKANRVGQKEVNYKESNESVKAAYYWVYNKGTELYKKYSTHLNAIQRWINYNYVTVLTHYHHDNSTVCEHYKEWLKQKDITQRKSCSK